MTLEATSAALMEESESFQQQFFSVIFIITGFVGAFGNTLVCVVIASTLVWSRSGNTNLLILHQAFIDDITSVILILRDTLPYPNIPKAGGWGEFVCRMWVAESLLWMLFVVSTYNLCMMSLERFVAVSYPVVYSTRFKRRTSLLMILFCWTIAPLLHYFYPVGDSYNDKGVCRKRAGHHVALAAVGITLFFWEFFIPFVFMAVVYARIVYLLRKQQRRVQGSNANTSHQGPHDGQPCAQPQQNSHLQVLPDESGARFEGASTGLSQVQGRLQVMSPQPLMQQQPHHQPQRRQAPSETVRRNVTVTFLAVFIMYGVCWMPNHLTFLQHGFGGPLDFNGTWLHLTLVLAYLNMSINPFIYALKYKLFREGFRRLFCCNGAGQLGRGNFVGRSTMSSGIVPTVSGSD